MIRAILTMITAIAFASLAALGGCSGKKYDANSKPAAVEPTPAPTGTPAVTTTPAAPAALEPARIAWEPFSVEAVGVTYDSIAGYEVRTGNNVAGPYVKQMVGPVAIVVQYGENQTLESWQRGWRSSRFVTSEATTVAVCGGDGTRQSAEQRPLSSGGLTVKPPDGVDIEERIKLAWANDLANASTKVAREGKWSEPAATKTTVPAPTAPTTTTTTTAPTPTTTPAPAPTTTTTTTPVPGSRTTVILSFTHKGKDKETPVVASWTLPTEERERLRSAEDRFFASFRCQ